MPPLKKRGLLASDGAFTEEIIRQADLTKEPFFFFAVTLQGHGPYPPEPLSAMPATRSTRRSANGRRVRSLSYAEGVSDADAGLKRLIDWASQAQAEDGHRLLRRPSAAARPCLCRDGLHEGAGRKPAERRSPR